MKHVCVVAPCYNEEGNVQELYSRLKAVFAPLASRYRFTILFIDNCSRDRTPAILRELAAKDPDTVRVIFNLRNYGHIRSPYYGLIQADGDANVLMASDLQDPPELLPQFLELWEKGNQVVMGVKTESAESALMFAIRKAYYNFINGLTDIQLIKNATGFGLYDKRVIEVLRKVNDPYPYFRGLVPELGFSPATISFHQPTRKRGVTSNNFYRLYDIAMLGITNHSKIPLRLATMAGFALSATSLLIAALYLLAKLVFWSQFSLGTAPILIGFFFFMSVQLFFIGIIGEYIGAIYTQVQNRPLVIERERIGF